MSELNVRIFRNKEEMEEHVHVNEKLKSNHKHNDGKKGLEARMTVSEP